MTDHLEMIWFAFNFGVSIALAGLPIFALIFGTVWFVDRFGKDD